MATKTADQKPDSRSVGACGLRTWAKKSKMNNPMMTAIVINQVVRFTCMGT